MPWRNNFRARLIGRVWTATRFKTIFLRNVSQDVYIKNRIFSECLSGPNATDVVIPVEDFSVANGNFVPRRDLQLPSFISGKAIEMNTSLCHCGDWLRTKNLINVSDKIFRLPF